VKEKLFNAAFELIKKPGLWAKLTGAITILVLLTQAYYDIKKDIVESKEKIENKRIITAESVQEAVNELRVKLIIVHEEVIIAREEVLILRKKLNKYADLSESGEDTSETGTRTGYYQILKEEITGLMEGKGFPSNESMAYVPVSVDHEPMVEQEIEHEIEPPSPVEFNTKIIY
jgi:hypothetical protein